jgi:sn-glycerol 3-phosphate transport system permease protein
MKRTDLIQVSSYIFKVTVGVLIILPIVLGLSMSFMGPGEIISIPPRFVPRNPVVYTWLRVTRGVPVFNWLFNSIVVCTVVIAGQIVTCSFGAYAFSFYRFKGQSFLFMVVLATLMIPADAIIIANYQTIFQIGLNNTYAALAGPYLSSAIGIFLIRQFFLSIPKELHEAARIDGCRDLRFLFCIVMPISKPAFASLGIYIFIGVYNQFFWPLLVTNTEHMRTVQVGMSFLKNAEQVDYGIVMAGAVLVLIPVIAVFIMGQRFLVKGMTAGSVKG